MTQNYINFTNLFNCYWPLLKKHFELSLQDRRLVFFKKMENRKLDETNFYGNSRWSCCKLHG